MKWIVLKQADWWLVFSWCVCDFYSFCPGLFQKNMALKCIWASKCFKNYNTETNIKNRERNTMLNQHCVDSYCLFFIVAFCVSLVSFYFSNWSKWIQKYKSFVKLMILIYQYHKSKINTCAISNGSRQVYFFIHYFHCCSIDTGVSVYVRARESTNLISFLSRLL